MPRAGEIFRPREVFGNFGLGLFIPERIASHRDIAGGVGVGGRQVQRALKELIGNGLIRTVARRDPSGRQTSNAYEFTWGPILTGESDISDTLPQVNHDTGRGTQKSSTGVSRMTPLEVTKRNHHQESVKERSTARAESFVRGNSERELSRSASQESKIDDDSASTEYASAKDELKAIYQAHRGDPIRVADLDAIESLLSFTGVPWEAFVAEARRHDWKRLTNPTGFLKKLARNFRLKTQAASAPVTAAEAADKDYRCQVCGSTVRGEGARLIDSKLVPCSCASPEWIARQREGGVFPPEADR